MGLFAPVDLRVDFIKLEHKILEFWKKERIFQQLMERNRGNPKWSFIDGPMTANNPMGVHHAWGRTYKDVFQRHRAMLGYDQRFQNGYDCQGLWLEVETEKALGFKSKQDIENFGLDNFSRACRERVNKFGGIITEQSLRLGQWMDWDNSYWTMTDTNIEYIWHFLGVCHDRGWLRQGHQVMPWCTRCGTSLSQHELSDSYKEIDDTSVFLAFPLKPGVRREGPWLEALAVAQGRKAGGDAPGAQPPTRVPAEGESLLVWTTTPWTLTSNVAAAVSPDLTYARVAAAGRVYYMSRGVVETVFGDRARVLEELPGSEMIGWVYEGPFDDLPAQAEVEHVVIPWEEVGETEGSGIVHIAPGCGAEDCVLGEELGLAAIAPLDGRGIYLEGFGWLTGRDVHEVEQPIFDDLKKKGVYLRHEEYRHRYPFCWRCHQKLVFRLEDEWFIGCDEIRPQMKAAAREVRWIPESVGKRTQDWYDNMGDWCISRKRYWGLPLPFYFCPDGHLTLVRSKQQLREFATDPKKVDDLPELHRPWIDEIQVHCQHAGCDQTATRTRDVGDCWLDAGIVAYSTMKYLEDPDYWRGWFPAEFICEMREQVRLWFYAMMFTSVTLEGRSPYKAVLSYEKLSDEKGEAMHRSRGNAIWFDEAVDRMGADVMRWVYFATNPTQNLRFGYRVADEVRRRVIMLWNVYSFLVTYAELDGFDPAREADPAEVGGSPNALDRWIISSLYQLVKEMRHALENYDPMTSMRSADAFLEQLSTWYVRRSRRRFWKAESDEDKKWAHRTLFHVLLTYVRLLAPIVPFVTEEIYGNLTASARAAGDQSKLRFAEPTGDPSRDVGGGAKGGPPPASVHLTSYPEDRPDLVDAATNEAMEFVLRAVSLGRAAREQARVKIRQPLGRLWIVPLEGRLPFADLDEALRENLLDQIREELNVKEVDLTETDAGRFGARGMKLNFPVLGRKLGAALKEVSAKVKDGDYEITADGKLQVGSHLLEAEEFEESFAPKEGLALAHDRYTMTIIDLTLTPELVGEGWAREVIRRIQDLRKQAGYQVEERIQVRYELLEAETAADLPVLGEVFEQHADYLCSETLAVALEPGRDESIDKAAELELAKGQRVWVGVRRI